ncbi:hypothetical protein [Haloechinothrix aidingensis]|uniref:hypothetical protein n=1 Tax=Haloechinothrix aidingensis TaxID=2752311 RepID=UPI0031B635B1
MRIAAAQLPAIDDSDDKIATTDHAVIMLDGASAFVPVPVPASAYADHLAERLRLSLTRVPDADLTATLAEAIRETADHFDLAAGESPSSTVTIARETGDHLDLLLLGDNLAILPGEIITDDRMDQLDLAPRTKYRQRLAAGSGYDEEHRRLLRELQDQQAQCRNRVDGYWIAEADPAAAAQAITARRSRSATPWLVLATDGAYNTMHHLALDDWSALANADSGQLHAVLSHCHRWEADDDPQAQALPRAKRHDDKSLASIMLTDR